MSRPRLTLLAATALAFVQIGSSAPTAGVAASPNSYALTDLGPSAVLDPSDPACAVYARGAEGISASGVIAGQLLTDTRTVPAASSDPSDPKFTKLSSPGTGGEGRDVNDSGLVVGAIHRKTSDLRCGDYRRAVTPVYWKDGERTELPSGDFDGGRIDAVNNDGDMAGHVTDINGESEPAAWIAGTLTMLPLPDPSFIGGNAYGINSDGVIVGSCFAADATGYSYDYAVTWQDGVATMLETPEGASSSAYDINDGGTIVGDILLQTDSGATENAVTWTDGKRDELSLPEGARGSAAFGINKSGEIAGSADTDDGTQAVVWLDGEAYFLKDLVPDVGDWTLIAAKDVSDGGTVVGYGVLDGQVHGFALTPES